MALVSLVACDNEEITNTPQTFSSTETKVKKDTIKNEPELKFYLEPVHSASGNVAAIADTVGERTTNTFWLQNGKAKLSLEQYEYVTEMKYKNLNVAYSNANKTISEPEVAVVNGIKKYTTKCSFSLEDGNIGYINAESYQRTEKVNGKEHTFEYAKLQSFEIVSLKNIETAKTRGAYIADSCATEVGTNLHYVYENSNVPAFDVLLVDTCFRKFQAEDEIDSCYVENKSRVVLTTSTEKCSFTKVVVYKSGNVTKFEKSIVLQYEVAPIDERELIVKSFAFGFVNTTGIAFGETAFNRTDGSWTVSRRNGEYNSNFATEANDELQTKYTLFSEGVIYDDGDVKVEFPVLDMSISEGDTNVTAIEGDDWYDKAKFQNTINADYQGYAQSASESVILKKEAKRLVWEGWDETTAKKVVSLWNIYTYIEYVKRYSDDSEERDAYEKNFSWSFTPDSKWSVEAQNTSHTTSAVVASIEGSDKTEKVGEANYSWTENSHSLVSNVAIADGTQYDKWIGTTANDIKVERNGNIYDFGHDDYSLTDNKENIVLAETNDNGEVYNYTHAVVFGFSGITAEVSVPGEIKIAKVVVPDTFFGSKVLSVSQVVCNNPTRTDYWYSVLAHLENGEVVPGIWNKEGNIEFHLEWSVKTEADLNGAVYDAATGTWVPVHAEDAPAMLLYTTEDGERSGKADSQAYPTAKQWNWDEGHLVNGHPSVTTERFSFTIENGVLSGTDTYTGNSVGSWTYAQ